MCSRQLDKCPVIDSGSIILKHILKSVNKRKCLITLECRLNKEFVCLVGQLGELNTTYFNSLGYGRFYEENFVILRTQWLLILLKYNADVLVERN